MSCLDLGFLIFPAHFRWPGLFWTRSVVTDMLIRLNESDILNCLAIENFFFFILELKHFFFFFLYFKDFELP